MTLDPRWIEILKASGWQTGAIALACALFLLLGKLSLVPPLDPWMIHLATISLLICGLLAIASLLSATLRVFPLQKWIVRRLNLRRAKRELLEYIPFMTSEEKQIIAYLLHKNQKTFTASSDGGYAATLLSHGFVVITARGGQHINPERVPMTIPEHLWNVLSNHKADFPYKPIYNGKYEVHPWRVSWMCR